MKAGMYVPVPHVTAHSERLAATTAAAQEPLLPLEVDPGFTLALEETLEAERLGYDIALFAERHMGPDLEAWVLASAVASHTSRIRIMPASNPDFWHPNLLAKLAASLDRIAPGRAAINFVTGWGETEIQYFSTQRHANDDARYARAEAFIETMRTTWSAAADSPLPPAVGAEFFPAPLPLVPGEHPIPIYAVSRSDRGLDMVAKSADYWFADYGGGFDRTFDDVLATAARSIADMRARAERFGRVVKFGISALVLPAESEEAGWALLDRKRQEILAKTPHLVMASLGAAGARLVGPPDLIAERAAAFAELGADLLLCKYIPESGALEAIADAIKPAVSVGS